MFFLNLFLKCVSSFLYSGVWLLFRGSGEKQVEVTIPNSVTEWKVNMFCDFGSDGFGISSTVRLTAFESFFAGLALPHSLIWGELFVLKVTMFKCLKRCIWVRSLLLSSGFPLSSHKTVPRHTVDLELL